MERRRRGPSKATFREAARAAIVKKTRRKFGKRRAQKQIVAIAFSKARRNKRRARRRKR